MKYGVLNPTLKYVSQIYLICITYKVLQTIQMELMLFSVWAEPVVLGSTKTALKFKYEIQIG